ncbi:MAG: hypothetical protein Q9219_006218 [cf. Caloplaca sp. 3 TL-2023]
MRPREHRPVQGWVNFGQRQSSATSTTSATSKKTIFSGIQPTGVPHLGNYLGALQQWVQIQNESQPTSNLLFSIVDLHAMTLPYDRDQLLQWRRQTLATLLAIGLDPNRSTIFFQSAVWFGISTLHLGIGMLMQQPGTSTHRAHVDLVLYSVGRVSFSHDTVEGPPNLDLNYRITSTTGTIAELTAFEE